MDIYYYCSYTSSPVGFQLGKLTNVKISKTMDADTSALKPYELKALDISKFDLLIQSCFEHHIVRKAYGVCGVDQKTVHFLLIKNLKLDKGADVTDDTPSEYYLNLALATEDPQEAVWLKGTDCTIQDIAETVKQTMEIDRANDFGFTVRPDKLQELLQKSFGALLVGGGDWQEPVPGENQIYFEFLSSKTDFQRLEKALGLTSLDPEQNHAFEPVNGSEKWFRYGKKKIRPSASVSAGSGGASVFAGSGGAGILSRAGRYLGSSGPKVSSELERSKSLENAGKPKRSWTISLGSITVSVKQEEQKKKKGGANQ